MPNLQQLAQTLEHELTDNILPFYQALYDPTFGGFYGRVDNNNQHDPHAPKGLVQHSRLLWTFAHAYRHLGHPSYLDTAVQAYDFLTKLADPDHGGYYWLADYRGQPLDRTKYVYGQAFAIYALSEYALATGHAESQHTAVALYHLLESKTSDLENGGYFEACTPNWSLDKTRNVDEVTGQVDKTMNTHLHLLEAYTNLYRLCPSPDLADSLRHLLHCLSQRIIQAPTYHFGLHFTANWTNIAPQVVSYGHDIEGSWLMVEAAEVLGDPAVLAETTAVALQMSRAVYAQALSAQAGLSEHPHSTSREWWPQAEAIVGFVNAWQLSQQDDYLTAATNIWHYTQANLVDKQHGDWFWGKNAQGQPLAKEKAGLWKTPYHNGRACLEIMRRSQTTLVQTP